MFLDVVTMENHNNDLPNRKKGVSFRRSIKHDYVWLVVTDGGPYS